MFISMYICMCVYISYIGIASVPDHHDHMEVFISTYIGIHTSKPI